MLTAATTTTTTTTPDSIIATTPQANNNTLYYAICIFFAILILSFFGINIFVYLAKGTEEITGYIDSKAEQINILFGHKLSFAFKTFCSWFVVGFKAAVAENSAGEAAAFVVGTAASALNSANINETDTDDTHNQVKQQQQQQQIHTTTTTNTSTTNSADETSNEVQPNNSQTSMNWCFVGEDRGYRSCVQVDNNTSCQSQQIFEDQQQCLQPELRYV